MCPHDAHFSEGSMAWHGMDPQLLRRLDRFLFQISDWAHPLALAQFCSSVEEKDLNVELRRWLLMRHAPVSDLKLNDLILDWRSRLALLDADEWFNLGLALGVLPFCGRIHASLDGVFRRVLRERFSSQIIEQLDALPPPDSTQPRFLLGAGAWKRPEQIAAGGLSAVCDLEPHWSPAVQFRWSMQFDPRWLNVPACIGGLNESWLEHACKITFQDHPWLWS